jgi:transposase InsO family protein
MHLRFGCKSLAVLKHTQKHVEGMQIQQGTWKQLETQLPCSACIAGKMRKTRKNPTKEFTEVNNLALSWTANTEDKETRANESVSLDWGIIHKRYLKDKNNVFALYLDNNTGLVFGYPAESTGQAGPSLLAYIQRYGIPKQVIHDNAQEFIHGEFAKICADKGIAQHRSPPYNPNKNPTEHYMEIITSTMRSLLFISGLNPNTFWEHALLQGMDRHLGGVVRPV